MIVYFGLDIFGKHLREARQKKGLSLQALADMTGCDWQYLQEVESGEEREVEMKLLLRLCDAVETPLDNLWPSDIPAPPGYF